MKQTILICGILIYESVLWSTPYPFAAGVRSTDTLTPEKEAKSFQLASGISIQHFASEPQINKPMKMAFDTRGRLWVTSTVEYPYPVKPGIKGRDTLKRLEDTNGDGTAEKRTELGYDSEGRFDSYKVDGDDTTVANGSWNFVLEPSTECLQ